MIGAHAQSERPSNDHVFGLSRVIMHERYGQLNNDVALLQLNRPLDLSGDKVKPVCLPQHGSRARPGTKCFITGLSLPVVLFSLLYLSLPTDGGKDATIHFTFQ